MNSKFSTHLCLLNKTIKKKKNKRKKIENIDFYLPTIEGFGNGCEKMHRSQTTPIETENEY